MARTRQARGIAKLTGRARNLGVVFASGLGDGPLHDAATGRIATAVGVSYAPSPYGVVASFNGSSSYAQLPVDLSKYTDISVLFYMGGVTGLETSSGYNMYLELTADGGANNGGFAFYNAGTPSYKTVFVHKGDGAAAAQKSGIERPDSAWHAYHLDSWFSGAKVGDEVFLLTDGVYQAFPDSAGNESSNTYKHANSTLNFMARNGSSLFTQGLLGPVIIFNRQIDGAEMTSYRLNPFQFVQDAPARRPFIFFGPAAGGTTTTVAPIKGALVATGYAPTITQPHTVAPSVGHATITGKQPGIEQDIAVAPAKGALSLIGYSPSITQPRVMNPLVGHATVTGHEPTVQQSASGTIAPTTGHATLTGHAPAITQPRTIAAVKGALTLAGYAPGVTQNVTTFIAPASGAIVVTGKQPYISTTANQAIAPVAGALTLGGYAPVLIQTGAQIIGPVKGALVLTGRAPTVQVIGTGLTLVEPTAGAMTLAGHAPLVRVAVTPGRGGYRFPIGGTGQNRPAQINADRPR